LKRLLFLIFLLTLIQSIYSQTIQKDTLTLIEWNVENLFDCQHDTLKNDYEFLPEGMRHWTKHRYYHKLDQIAKMITAIGGWSPPALIALCEVENDSVLVDLTQHSALRELNYRYVMTRSSDPRGIDVALLYQRDCFKLISASPIIIPKLNNYKPTRDILHVEGQIITGDTIDLFIVHAPSRSGGQLESEPYRVHCMNILSNKINEELSRRSNANIIITGDFNDFPENRSIKNILKAEAPTNFIKNDALYHLLARRVAHTHEGTYKYQGEWNLLDHFIVNGRMLDTNNVIYTSESMADIVQTNLLLEKDETYGGLRPCRTYYGMKYKGGYSDHLPIRLNFIITQR
jgi:exonuclease III